jgi:hypothetical protein
MAYGVPRDTYKTVGILLAFGAIMIIAVLLMAFKLLSEGG